MKTVTPEQFRAMRAFKKLSLDDARRLMGISMSALYDFETGKRPSRRKTLKAINDFYNQQGLVIGEVNERQE